MKTKTIKSALIASLILLSLSCFVYVNTESMNRALDVETVSYPTKSDNEQVENSSKMPDLVLIENVLTVLQKCLPAK